MIVVLLSYKQLLVLGLKQQGVALIHLVAVLNVARLDFFVVNCVGDLARFAVRQRVPNTIAANQNHPIFVRLLCTSEEFVAGFFGNNNVSARWTVVQKVWRERRRRARRRS